MATITRIYAPLIDIDGVKYPQVYPMIGVTPSDLGVSFTVGAKDDIYNLRDGSNNLVTGLPLDTTIVTGWLTVGVEIDVEFDAGESALGLLSQAGFSITFVSGTTYRITKDVELLNPEALDFQIGEDALTDPINLLVDAIGVNHGANNVATNECYTEVTIDADLDSTLLPQSDTNLYGRGYKDITLNDVENTSIPVQDGDEVVPYFAKCSLNVGVNANSVTSVWKFAILVSPQGCCGDSPFPSGVIPLLYVANDTYLFTANQYKPYVAITFQGESNCSQPCGVFSEGVEFTILPPSLEEIILNSPVTCPPESTVGTLGQAKFKVTDLSTGLEVTDWNDGGDPLVNFSTAFPVVGDLLTGAGRVVANAKRGSYKIELTITNCCCSYTTPPLYINVGQPIYLSGECGLYSISNCSLERDYFVSLHLVDGTQLEIAETATAGRYAFTHMGEPVVEIVQDQVDWEFNINPSVTIYPLGSDAGVVPQVLQNTARLSPGDDIGLKQLAQGAFIIKWWYYDEVNEVNPAHGLLTVTKTEYNLVTNFCAVQLCVDDYLTKVLCATVGKCEPLAPESVRLYDILLHLYNRLLSYMASYGNTILPYSTLTEVTPQALEIDLVIKEMEFICNRLGCNPIIGGIKKDCGCK